MNEGVAAADVETWKAAVGRTETRTESLDVESLRRFAAATGADLDVERAQPSLAHWAFFLPVAAGADIGPDGHPKRGGFMPAIPLPRRMFAGAAIRFSAPLALGRPATRSSTIADVKHKPGRSGDLVFVEVDHTITQEHGVSVFERQTIVYRPAGESDAERVAVIVPTPQPEAVGDVQWQPGAVDLFRFSAVTFNSHRIHYDAPYVTAVEGYPGLVVHGPFTATKLHGYARSRLGRPLNSFSFRATAPLFVDQPIRLTGGDQPGAFRAIRCDGVVAMTTLAGL